MRTNIEAAARVRREISLLSHLVRQRLREFSICAQNLDASRRGHIVGVWWQLLSVAFQKERERVLSQKAISSLQFEGGDLVAALDVDVLSLLPCLTG